MIAYINLFRGDGKPHPVEGVFLLLGIITVILCFDKCVIRKEKTHERYYKSYKILKRERSASKRFWYSVLQMIDVLCGLYFRRNIHMDEEPFRKATETEKRVGSCFMIFLPLFFAFMINHAESFGAIVDSMIYGRQWIGWFYLGVIALVGVGVVFAIKVAPKIPLFVSVPTALISWPVLGWVVWKHNLI